MKSLKLSFLFSPFELLFENFIFSFDHFHYRLGKRRITKIALRKSRACICACIPPVSRSIHLPLSMSRSSVKAIARRTPPPTTPPSPTRGAPCSNIARISSPRISLIDLSQNYSAATRRKFSYENFKTSKQVLCV